MQQSFHKKIAIISNIDVHRERITRNKFLFNPNDYKENKVVVHKDDCLLYTSPSPRDS